MQSGAMALFGEKYGEEVRVVTMGTTPGTVSERAYSVELCGGTHVARTGEIGLITLVGEAGVAAGVRRLEALTGAAARKYLGEQEKRLRAAALALKVRPDEVAQRAAALMEERRKLERELADARKKIAMGGNGTGAGDNAIKTVNGIRFFSLQVSGLAANDLKALVDEGKAKVGSGVSAVVNTTPEGKASLVVGVTDDLVARFNSVALVKAGAEAIGGKGGGGRPDLAQAGGPDGGNVAAALAAIEAAIGAAG
jgi:alanyl-tRNA synthetase